MRIQRKKICVRISFSLFINSEKEIDKTIELLHRDEKDLHCATSLAELAVAVVEGFQYHVSKTQLSADDLHDIAKFRWRKAIRKVIFQLQSTKVKDRLLKMGWSRPYHGLPLIEAPSSKKMTPPSEIVEDAKEKSKMRKKSRRTMDNSLLMRNNSNDISLSIKSKSSVKLPEINSPNAVRKIPDESGKGEHKTETQMRKRRERNARSIESILQE